MVFEEMIERIDELHSTRNISELKKYLNDINPADIAQLLEEFEDERKRVFLFRLLARKMPQTHLLNLTVIRRKI